MSLEQSRQYPVARWTDGESAFLFGSADAELLVWRPARTSLTRFFTAFCSPVHVRAVCLRCALLTPGTPVQPFSLLMNYNQAD